jgi:outer membrane immunogenic protein
MRYAFAAVIAIFSGLASSSFASAQSNDLILKRLERIEKENATLRERVRRLEGTKVVAAPTGGSQSNKYGAGGAALAADMPVKARFAPAAFNWSGYYFGGVVGGALFDNSFADQQCAFACDGADMSRWAFTAGLTAGVNWQFGSGLVGLEADINWANFKNELSSRGFGYVEHDGAKWDWFSTVRGRAGLAVDRTLLYVTGGIAIAKPKYFAVYDVGGSGLRNEISETKVGLAGGAGAEFALSNNLSAKAEYLFIGLPDTRTHVVTSNCTPNDCFLTFKSNAHILRAGLNYKFDSGAPFGKGPVVAGY